MAAPGKPQKRFMHEDRRLKAVGSQFTAQVGSREFLQFVINQRNHSVHRVLIPGMQALQH